MAKLAGSRTLWKGFIVVMLLAILSFSVTAEEFPIAESPQLSGGFWANIFSTKSTVPLQMFTIYNTDQCRSIYEGECDSIGKLQFNCYADSAGTCRCTRGDVWTTATGTKYYASQKCGATGGTSTLSCTDSDYGKATQIKGTAESSRMLLGSSQTVAKVIDFCKTTTTLTEAYCKDDGNVATQEYTCAVGTTCQEGACKTTTTPSTVCRDTDGGINPQVKGTVTERRENTDIIIGSDFCLDFTQIREYYCNGDKGEITTRNCGSNERCVKQTGQAEASCQPATGCTDTDERNIYTKGSVTWNSQTVTDTCNSAMRVTEYSCSNGVRTQIDTACPSNYKCENGACIIGTVPGINPPAGGGNHDGFAGANCVDDTYCQSSLTCSGTSEQKVQGSGTCTASGGTGGIVCGNNVCESGETTDNCPTDCKTTPPPTKTKVCCQTSSGTPYWMTGSDASACSSSGFLNLGRDNMVADDNCVNAAPPVATNISAISQLNATVETKQPSVPIGRLDTASGATLLSALCTKDADCSSGNCADIETLEVGLKSSSRSILDRINEAKQDQASTISQITDGLSQGWLTKIILKLVGGAFFNVDAITQTPKGICVIERENALTAFWENNQTAILIGGAVLVGLMFISKMGNK